MHSIPTILRRISTRFVVVKPTSCHFQCCVHRIHNSVLANAMTSFSQACRLLRNAQLNQHALIRRGFRSSGYNGAAKGFKMPAMSPTMVEGNIAKWSVKEGDKFSAGDVLLEIETDKANIDVEAADDGILAKILAQDGAKGIKVGTRIAVLADLDDDLATLEIPPETTANSPPSAEVKTEKPAHTPQSAPQPRLDPIPKDTSPPTNAPKSKHHPEPKIPHTPSPSVASLLKIHGLKVDDLSRIQGTGPRGRLLKGDILAHVGSIHKDIPKQLEANFDKLAHLDLSNIIIKPQPKKEETKAAAPVKSEPPQEVVLRYAVSLERLNEVQSEIQESFGFTPPLSAFIDEAARLASKGLPASNLPPTADQIFDELVGAPKRSTLKKAYQVQLETAPLPKPLSRLTSENDIIDILSGSKPKSSLPKPSQPSATPEAQTFVTLKVRVEDKARGDAFLSKVTEYVRDEPQTLLYSWGNAVKASASSGGWL